MTIPILATVTAFPNGFLFVAPILIFGLLLACLIAVAWRRSMRRGIPPLVVSGEELALLQRAAEGETAAAEALKHLAAAEVAGLKRRAATDREAALRYRDRIRDQLRILEPLHGRLSGMELDDQTRNEIEQRIAVQQTEALRELAWIESRLERRGR